MSLGPMVELANTTDFLLVDSGFEPQWDHF